MSKAVNIATLKIGTTETSSIAEQFDKEIAAYRGNFNLANRRCTRAILAALGNSEVRTKCIEKAKHFVPMGISCIQPEFSIPEFVYVLFEYACPPGMYCFLNPSFLVIVDMMGPTPIVHEDGIEDPYFPQLCSRGVLWGTKDCSEK